MTKVSPKPSRLRIAICVTRGIPACYGGFETFAEELSWRLVERGHEVVVYGRRHLYPQAQATYRGVTLRLLPAVRHKYLETPLHTLLCLMDLVYRPVDVILVCNAANSPFIWLPRLFRNTPLAINVDGIERLRAKWNAVGRLWYRLGEQCSVWFSSKVVSDAEVIRRYYQERYGCDSEVLRYGCQKIADDLAARKVAGAPEFLALQTADEERLFSELSIEPGRYILYVSRLEPENNAHVVIRAHNALPPKLREVPLVIVGDAPYAQDYIEGLKSEAGPSVRFAGYRFGADYRALQLHAKLYVQATEVGGTHPALVEAMGFANAVVANATPENVEVLNNCGAVYRKNDAGDLSAVLRSLLEDESQLLKLRGLAFARARREFDWDKITSGYEELFQRLTT